MLCVLDRWFVSKDCGHEQKLSVRDMARIFRTYFQDTIKVQGRPHDISDLAVSAQLREISEKGLMHEAWQEVFLNTEFSGIDSDWAVTKQELLDTASSIGITLELKSSEDRDSILAKAAYGVSPRKRRRQEHKPARYSSDESEQSDQMMGDNLPKTPHHRCSTISSLKTPPITPGNTANGLNTPPATPSTTRISTVSNIESSSAVNISEFGEPGYGTIGYRFWDDRSQGFNTPGTFRAGALINLSLDEILVHPADFNSESFQQSAHIHLTRVQEPTNFVSVWRRLLPALHRGLRSNANANIAFIDLSHINANQPLGRRLFSATDVLKKLRANNKLPPRFKYNGCVEWLVYNYIEDLAIVASFSIAALRVYLQARPELEKFLRLEGVERAKSSVSYNRYIEKTALPLNPAAGCSIGHFLAFTGLPRRYLENVALDIARVWRFRDRKIESQTQSYLEKVHTGYLEFFEELLPATGRRSLEECGGPLGLTKHLGNDEFVVNRVAVERTLGLGL